MKKLLQIFFITQFLYSCNTKRESTESTSLKNDIKSDSIVVVDLDKKVIQWKLNGMTELLTDTLEFSLPNLNNSVYEWKNDDYISIKSSCGSPCWYSYLLPIKKGKKVKRFFYSIGNNPNGNLIIYQPDKLDSKYMLRVENIKTNKFQDIKRIICPSELTHLCIESVNIKKDLIEIHWKKDFFVSSSLKLKDSVTTIKLLDELLLN